MLSIKIIYMIGRSKREKCNRRNSVRTQKSNGCAGCLTVRFEIVVGVTGSIGGEKNE